jgi:hypothetical protein
VYSRAPSIQPGEKVHLGVKQRFVSVSDKTYYPLQVGHADAAQIQRNPWFALLDVTLDGKAGIVIPDFSDLAFGNAGCQIPNPLARKTRWSDVACNLLQWNP